jgi:hypothetical protein
MSLGFVATQFSVNVKHNVLIVTLGAPSSKEDDFYLMLQHKDEYTTEDIKFGMDLPYIEYCGQGWSWYGHIQNFSLNRKYVRVQMDEEAATHMHNDGLIEVQFNLNDTQYEELRSALRRTFQGFAYYCEEGQQLQRG